MSELVDSVRSVQVGAAEQGLSATYGNSRHFYLSFKRLLDLFTVISTAPVTIPLILVLAVLVQTGGGRAIYRQRRLGMHGRSFYIWKLRTMVPDADSKLESFLAENPEARAEWNETQKLRRDPRITPLGRFLRKTSLDELPQLFNVLMGEMSLVGPRPMMPEQRAYYPGTAYFSVRPAPRPQDPGQDRRGCGAWNRCLGRDQKGPTENPGRLRDAAGGDQDGPAREGP
jgi:lipopolysaccharide/colanic/teichoic acid biosynthesis glycosyltransferase